jgi:hypothetical protein
LPKPALSSFSNSVLRVCGLLEQDKLPDLLKSKYQTLEDAKEVLGDVNDIVPLFTDFQKYLYQMGDFFKPCPSRAKAGFKKSPSG